VIADVFVGLVVGGSLIFGAVCDLRAGLRLRAAHDGATVQDVDTSGSSEAVASSQARASAEAVFVHTDLP
jgi:hypothetical protein